MDVLSHGDGYGETELQDIEICKHVAEVLMRHYPGHLWHVSADSSPTVRMIDIKLMYPDRLGVLPKFGYKMKIDNASPTRIMKAGGELLERFRLARGAATPYSRMEAIENGMDIAGEIR